ncbi:hypothetical protein CCUS01_06684 [Colletotrichum cuscutae]|uniref:Uncharacterized protein n=1 Tax=Colletotrichum cuscutae TaxID=1209917 RepID=A0AAI9V3R8_9PEZI|nr:hypothetical protein CCUS01_06684 [Colletotrichum cuscutae]
MAAPDPANQSTLRVRPLVAGSSSHLGSIKLGKHSVTPIHLLLLYQIHLHRRRTFASPETCNHSHGRIRTTEFGMGAGNLLAFRQNVLSFFQYLKMLCFSAVCLTRYKAPCRNIGR